MVAIGILIPLKDTSAVEGTKAVIEAKISAQDVMSVKWFHNDEQLKASDRVQMVAKGAKQRLVFNRTYASDEGQYKLVVGLAETSCRLAVQSKNVSLLTAYIHSTMTTQTESCIASFN